MKHTLRKVNAWWWRAAARRPLLMCLLGGGLMALAFPPFPVPLLAVLGWLPLWAVLETHVAAREGKPLRRWGRWWRTFAYSYVFYLVWNLGVNYWLFYTGWNLDEPAMRTAGFISGLAANVANPVIQSLPIYAWLFLRRRVGFRWAWAAFVPMFVGLEEFHLNWDLTWSWTTLGNAFATWPGYVQYIEFTGVLGATAFTVAMALGLLAMGQRARTGQPIIPRLWGTWVGALVLPLVLWPVLTYSGRDCFQPTGYANTRVIQPNIDPYEEKFGGMAGAQQVELLMRLSLKRAPDLLHPDSIDLVVMPETGVPGRILEYDIDNYPLLQPLISAASEHPRMHLLAGILSVKLYPEGTVPESPSARCGDGHPCFDVYNAAAFVGPGMPTQVYRKSRLVPFSERPPFMAMFKALKDMNLDLGGGLGAFGIPDSINIVQMKSGTGVGPIICYESIFPGYVRQVVQAGAQVLCIITNDGWWKDTHGYRQHAAFASLRAIETRRAIARAANTGQSCFISPEGYLTQPTEWWAEAVIDARLPLLSHQTLYVQLGDWLGRLCLYGSLLLLPLVRVWQVVRRGRKRS